MAKSDLAHSRQTEFDSVERVTGIEPVSLPWQGSIIPLYDTRTMEFERKTLNHGGRVVACLFRSTWLAFLSCSLGFWVEICQPSGEKKQ